MATMNNIREKIANARELCPGMSKDFYLLTDYMSAHLHNQSEPMGIMLMTVCVRDDLEKGRCGFAEGSELPSELAKRREFIKDEIKWIPQLVDVIADEEFAQEFRQIWKKTFGFVPPKRVNTQAVEIGEQYPKYVKVAVDWWANAIVSPKFDNGEAIPPFLILPMSSVKEYSQEEIKIFKEALAKEIVKEMNEGGDYCNISVDYHPCRVLAKAGELIGVNDMMGYPCKTRMEISKQEVSVSAGYGASWETLWTANE